MPPDKQLDLFQIQNLQAQVLIPLHRTCACVSLDAVDCYERRYSDYVNEDNEECECPCHDPDQFED